MGKRPKRALWDKAELDSLVEEAAVGVGLRTFGGADDLIERGETVITCRLGSQR